MQITYNSYALLPLLALFIGLVTVACAWRYRTKPIAMVFLVLVLAQAEWSLAASLKSHSGTEKRVAAFYQG